MAKCWARASSTRAASLPVGSCSWLRAAETAATAVVPASRNGASSCQVEATWYAALRLLDDSRVAARMVGVRAYPTRANGGRVLCVRRGRLTPATLGTCARSPTMAAVAPIAAAFPCARSATRPSAGAAAPVVALGGRPAFLSTVQLPQRRRRVVAAAKKSSAPEVEAAAFNTEEVLQTLKEKWDATENKTSVALYAGGAFAALWASSTLVSIVNAVPLVRADAKAASRRLGGVSVSVRQDRKKLRCNRIFSVVSLSLTRLYTQLPKVMELIGLSYSSWFVYRYLLFKARPSADEWGPAQRVGKRIQRPVRAQPFLLPLGAVLCAS
jgi:hypothetical protein